MDVEKMRIKARNNFLNGYNCTQSVLCAFTDEWGEEKTGMSHKTAMHVGASFGAGMGRLREVCGTVSGIFAAAGILYGYDEESAPQAKGEHYALIQELARRFTEKNGSIVCRDLLGLPPKKNTFDTDSPQPEVRTAEYYKKRPCPDLVGDAAAILAVLINEKENAGKN